MYIKQHLLIPTPSIVFLHKSYTFYQIHLTKENIPSGIIILLPTRFQSYSSVYERQTDSWGEKCLLFYYLLGLSLTVGERQPLMSIVNGITKELFAAR